MKRARSLRAGPATAQVARVAASALHLNRRRFQLEAETRLLRIETDSMQHDHRDLPLDGLIDQIMIGPTIDVGERANAKRRLLDAGAPMSTLCCSLLYHEPLKS